MIGAKRIVVAVATIAAVTAVAGCFPNGSFRSKGTMDGLYGGTAQLQLNITCNAKTGQVSGAMSFTDKGAKFIVIGTPTYTESLDYVSTISRPSRSGTAKTPQTVETPPPAGSDCNNSGGDREFWGTYLSLVTHASDTFYLDIYTDSDCDGVYVDFFAPSPIASIPDYSNSGCASGTVTNSYGTFTSGEIG